MRAAVFAILGLLVGSVERADAMCGNPQWNGTASMDVPMRGVLFVYNEAGDAPKIYTRGTVKTVLTAEGTRVARLTFDDSPQRLRTVYRSAVTRIEYEGTPGSELVVNLTPYRLVRNWTASSTAPRVTSYSHHLHAWTCSSTDVLSLSVDQPTAAIRARWTHLGSTKEWVIPALGSDATSNLRLGRINCGGTTLPPQELASGGRLELIAIRLDGSEVPIVGVPEVIATWMMPTHGTLERERWSPPEDPGDDELRNSILLLLIGLSSWLPRFSALAFARHDRH